MADLSTLNIQIQASTKTASDAIDKLIGQLRLLNGALDNYSSNSSYIKGLGNLTAGLNSVADAVAGIDVNNIQAVASKIGTLATKGANLSKLNFARPLTEMGKAAGEASVRTKKVVDELSSAFGVSSKKGIEELTSAVNKFYASAGNDTSLKNAEEEICDVIRSYTEVTKEADHFYQSVRNWVSNTNFALPKGALSETVDDYKRLRGVLGISNTTSDMSKAVGLDSMLEEMNAQLGTKFNTEVVEDGFRELVSFLEQGRDALEEYNEQERDAVASSAELSSALDRLYESIGKVREATSSLKTDSEGFLDVDAMDFDEAILGGGQTEKLAEVGNVVEEVKMKVEDLTEIGNPFEGLVNGLESLVGININADQFAGIKTLSESIGKLTGTNVEKASYTLPSLASGLAALSGINIPTYGPQLTELANGLGKLGSKAIGRAQNLSQVAEGLRKLQFIKVPNLEGLHELALSLGKLGNASVSKAVVNMPMLANSFRELMTTLSSAPKVSAETIQLANAMAQLASSSDRASTSTGNASSRISLLKGAVKAVLPSFKKATKQTFSLAAMFGKLYASYFLVIRAFRGLGQSMSIASQLAEVQNVVATVFGDMSDKLDTFADKAIYDFGVSELAARQYASRYQAMGQAMGITDDDVAKANALLVESLEGQKRQIEGVTDNYAELGDTLADMSINMTKLAADYASFFDADFEDVAQDMRSVLTGMAKPMYDYGISLREADIKQWALNHGINANMKAMTQAEKTMLRYQYVMANSAKVMNDYQITMNQWANVLRTIRQQFVKLGSIIGEGLIQVFKPALIAFREFLNTFISLTQKALNAVGKLLGWQIEIEEVGVSLDEGMSDYADSIDDATGAAKKLNSQLRSIDELNNLSSNKDSGGDGSAAGLAGLGGAGGQTTGGGWRIEQYESDIQSWFDLGDRIKNKIIGALKDIDWEEISEKVKLNAKGFVEFLKGLLFPDDEGNTLGGEIGIFLAQSINLGFDWLVTSTGDKALWAAAGNNIADFFLKFFENLDVEDMAETINNIVLGLKTMITTAVEKLNTPENREMIAGKIADFFKKIEPETWRTAMQGLGIYLGAVAIKGISKWLISDFIKKQLETALAEKLTASGVGATIAQGAGIVIAISLLIDDITVTKEASDKFNEVSNAYDVADDETVIKSPKKWFQDVKEQGWRGFFQMFKEGFKISALGLPDSSTAFKLKSSLSAKDLNEYANVIDELSDIPDMGDTIDDMSSYIAKLDELAEKYGMTREALIALKKAYAGYNKEQKKSDVTLPEHLQKYADFYKELGVPSELVDAYSNFYAGFSIPVKIFEGLEDTDIDLILSIQESLTGHRGGGAGHTFGEIGEENAEEYIDGFNRGVETNSNETQNVFSKWWNENITPWFTREKWALLGNQMVAGITLKWTEFTLWWQNTGLYKWWTEKVQPWFTREKWAALGENIKLGLTTKWEEFKLWWSNTGLKKWIDETTEKFNKLRDDITGEDGLFARMQAKASEVWDAISQIFSQGFDMKMPHFSWDESDPITVSGIAAKALDLLGLPTSIPRLKVDWYADGGFPQTGSLFFAGEAGAELLGSVNGRTTVASNGEITGISDTIRQTASEEMILLRAILGAVQSGSTLIIDGKVIANSVRQADSEYYKMNGTGMFAH